MSRLRFTSLAEAARAVERLQALPGLDLSQGTWSPARVLHHCAASLECSVRGFPRRKPWPVRAIARALVLPRFMRQGYMRHDLETGVPGLAERDPGPALGPAVARLLSAIDEFTAAVAHAPHAVFGDFTRDAYDRYHAMHIAEHASTFVVDGQPFAP